VRLTGEPRARRGGRSWAAALALGLAATAVVAGPATAAPPDGDSQAVAGASAPTPMADPVPTGLAPMDDGYSGTVGGQAAMSAAAIQAHKSGKPVEVDALTTETQQIIAQPEGGLVYEGNPLPVRTRRHGHWVGVDTSLHTAEDGTLIPVATAYGNVAFSGGGAGPLAATSYNGTHYTISWPGTLPKPSVSRDTATYRDVLPGIDLAVRATSTGGFSEVLVVKSAGAAKSHALSSLTLPTVLAAGRFATAHAPEGVTVAGNGGATLDTGTPLMWDSHRAAGDSSDDRHASVAARIAPVTIDQRKGGMRLTPDANLLTGAATSYPVYIDPTFNWHPTSANKPAFDEVKQGSPCNGASYYDNTGSAGNFGQLGVGYNGWPGGCTGDEHAYYQWSIPSAIWGATVSSATVKATEVYASQCSTTSTVNLHWTGAISSKTDWNNKPGYVNGFSTSASFAPAYNGDGCPDNGSVENSFNVLTPMTQAASGHWNQFTAALTQDSTESSKNRNAFKRFSDNPSLQISYDHAPTTPTVSTLAATIGSDKAGCATAAPYPYVGKTIASNTPVLSAKISDPDADKLQATFTYWLDGATGTKPTGTSADNLASNSTAKFNLPSTFLSGLTNGKIVDWQVQVGDGKLNSGLSSVCHFIAEPTSPLKPTVTSDNDVYPDLDADDPDDPDGTSDRLGAAAGTTGAFSLANDSSDGGAVATKFAYGLDVPPPTSNPSAAQTVTATSATGSTQTASIPITPKAAGPHTLWVESIDAAGDVSPMFGYRFLADHLPSTVCDNFNDCLNNVAITADTNQTVGNADGANSFSAPDLTNAGWTSGGKVVVDGASITLPGFGTGKPDNILSAGQQITFNYTAPTTGSSALVFLATATNPNSIDPGSISQNVTAPYVPSGTAVSGIYCFEDLNAGANCAPQGAINYNGISQPQNYFLTVPDWNAGPPDLAAVTLPHRNGPSGQVAKSEKIYSFSVPITAGATIDSIKLPEVGLATGSGAATLHIFGIGTRNTTTGTIEANGTTVAVPAGQSWTGVWASPTEMNGNFNTNGAAFSNQTFRVLLKPSLSGTAMRIKLDNALGTSKLAVGHATVAVSSGPPPANTPTGSFKNLTFSGSAGTTIPAGGMEYSDPLAFNVTANQWLLVSFDVTNSVPFIPEHSWASETDAIYISAPGSGDHTADTTGAAFAQTVTGTHSGYFTDVLTNLDVTTANVPTQVVFGDGLVDAWQKFTSPNSTTGTRFSDNLAAAEPSTPNPYGTLAEGIESNYVMSDDPQKNPDNNRAVGGPSALSRIDRDVLDQPGVNTVVLDEGLEDVLNGRDADGLEANGYTELLSYLQANGMNTIAIGLHACDGYAGGAAATATNNDPCTATVDGVRTAVNGWLSGGFPLSMGPWSTPALFYIDPDAATGVPDTANGLTKLDANAATSDHINLSNSGYAALTTAYLNAEDAWPLNDGEPAATATSAADTASNANNPYSASDPQSGEDPATLTGGATWATDPTRGTVLALDGISGGGNTDGPALDTSRSYSISAWAKLSSNAASATVATQEDTTNAAFSLRYDKTLNAWTFSVNNAATGTATTTAHGSAPALNSWTHLVGVYNAGTKSLTLYVNGAQAANPVTFNTPWHSAGQFDIGKAASTSYFPGALSDVRAWNYALTPTQVTAMDQQLT
jgi:hypothetical protein